MKRIPLLAIESYVSTVEYELAGLREAVNDALLQFARADESADRQAVERVRALPARQIVGSDGHVRDMLLRADVLRAIDGGPRWLNSGGTS